MTKRHYLLIGLAAVFLIVAIGVVQISQKVEEFIVEQGAAGAYLAARQATRLNDAQAAGDYWARALAARPGDAANYCNRPCRPKSWPAHLMKGWNLPVA